MCDKYKWDSNQLDKEKGLITSMGKTIQMHNIYILHTIGKLSVNHGFKIRTWHTLNFEWTVVNEFYLRWKQNTLFPKQYSL